MPDRVYDEDGVAFSLEDEGVRTLTDLDGIDENKIMKMTRGELAKVHREVYKQYCMAH